MKSILIILFAFIFVSCGDSGKKQENTDIISADTVKKEKQEPDAINTYGIIYLYQTETTDIMVHFTINGSFTSHEQQYNKRWNVTVTPDGLIDNKYDYLSYETELNKVQHPREGWVVKYNNLKKWFDKKLLNLGLNTKEAKQFKNYWLKKLKKANYYVINMIDSSFVNDNMKLTINPVPQTIIRLIFYFHPEARDIINLKEPAFMKKERIGYTVIELGGMIGLQERIIR